MEKILKVKEAFHRDVGKAIARIPISTMRELGIEAGDIIEIEGKEKAYAIVLPLPEEGEIIRMDGVLRKNASVGIDDVVTIKKVDATPAEEVTLAPHQEIEFDEDFIYYLKERLMNIPFVKGNTIAVGIMDQYLLFDVISCKPSNKVLQFSAETKIKILKKPVRDGAIPSVTYEDIGGLKEVIELVRETIELPLKHPEVFKRLGIQPPKGILFYGPPGCGKTLLAKAIAHETDSHFYLINGPEIMSKYYGESEENLRRIFREAEKNAPSIIFIDEIDAIAPKRGEVKGEVERRVVAQLLTLMDGLKSRGQVIVIGATNRINDIDEALRRPGRFDREIEIGIPNRHGRLEILQIHTRNMPLDKNVNLEEIADLTHGFSGADIEMLCKEAALNSLRRILPEIKKHEGKMLSREILEKIVVKREDFLEALKKIQPSTLREVVVQAPKVKWEDIGGLEEVKQQLIEAVEWPLKYSKTFERLNIKPVKGILLFGPPGCGKTLLAKAVANESQANFIAVNGPELLSKWVGESERAIREIFRKAKLAAPSIIFFDEIDAIASHRGSEEGTKVTERMVDQLLVEMDGLNELSQVVVIAATNRIDLIDRALLRPGRFDKRIYVPLPDKATRKKIFEAILRNTPLAKDVNIEKLVEKTKGYTGADIRALCNEAGMEAIREDKNAKEIKMKHFEKALKRIRPSLTKEQIKMYEKIAKEYVGKT